MQSTRVALAALLVGAVALAPAQAQRPAANRATTAAPADLAGEWIFVMATDPQPQRVRVAVTGDSVSGRVYGTPFSGQVQGGRVRFRSGSYDWRATWRSDSLVGWVGVAPDSSRFYAFRVRPPVTPRALRLEPTSWALGFDAARAAALRVFPGDTVLTRTVDAAGWDRGAFGARGNRPAPGGNPLVGPIYVEGAVPGDVLEVTLHRVRLNRDWAFSGTWLVDQAIDASYAAERKAPPQNAALDNQWVLDTVTQTARLRTPTPALAALRVPVQPFLGVIGTAVSPDFTPSSRESGTFGGNMENRWMREGTTVFLPVRQLGGLLYLGDGHAAQGDGELTGDAMETSLDVSFSVRLRRFGFQPQVRAVDTTQLLTHGVGGSLDEAMRRATSDLARWLEADYGLSATETAVLLGFAVQYDITDVVAPGYGVTARIAKSQLPMRRP